MALSGGGSRSRKKARRSAARNRSVGPLVTSYAMARPKTAAGKKAESKAVKFLRELREAENAPCAVAPKELRKALLLGWYPRRISGFKKTEFEKDRDMALLLLYEQSVARAKKRCGARWWD